jgi:predicted transposase YbfD/YdcC
MIAIQKLLGMPMIEGSIITIGVIGCQRNITQKVVEKKADYVLVRETLPLRRRGQSRFAARSYRTIRRRVKGRRFPRQQDQPGYDNRW